MCARADQTEIYSICCLTALLFVGIEPRCIYIFVKRQKNNSYVLSTVSTACVIRNRQLLLKANEVWSLCHYKIDPLDAYKCKINKK